ncbi:ArsR/SmtB family transcription factor [Cohnella nanjingensis]|uniref:Helix-turn-helix transcriptional regulator n=1 Tax=Cohnella nanjingensis TaxID=1387779 RepID=A0A7X0VGD9_9BACL|nr:metalloregulator ArsR/SmtB family transcription factor [Cohnella nanjingensis]MBB6671559.1 helix-turn-helix transcriptional regulator [Cohnella nanjingensis]
MDTESCLQIIKALSNETRLHIMRWLQTPDEHFGPQNLPANGEFDGGVCVGAIQERSGLTQSVISGYLATMQKAGLLESRRYGQWTYYRRNAETIDQFLAQLRIEL